MIIYLVKNKIDGKEYIGQTIKPLSIRWSQHRHVALLKSGKCYLHNAIRQYGSENFDVSVIARAASLEELNALEKKFISERGTMCPNGYNLTTGGDSKEFSEDVCRKISAAKKGRRASPALRTALEKLWQSNIGRKMPADAIAKVVARHKGSKRSLQARANISAAVLGKKRGPFSEDHCRKISEGLKGKPKSLEHRNKLRKPKSPEHRAKMSKIRAEWWAKKRQTASSVI